MSTGVAQFSPIPISLVDTFPPGSTTSSLECVVKKKFAELEIRTREQKKISRREIYEILGGFLSEFSTYSDWIYWMFSE